MVTQLHVVIIRNVKASIENVSEGLVNKTKHIRNTKYVIEPSSVIMQQRKGAE